MVLEFSVTLLTNSRKNNVINLNKHFICSSMSNCTSYYVHKEAGLLLKSDEKCRLCLYNKKGTLPLQLDLPKISPHLPSPLSWFWRNAQTARLAKRKCLHHWYRNKTYTVSTRPKLSAFLAFILQLPHTNQISHFQGSKEIKHKL